MCRSRAVVVGAAVAHTVDDGQFRVGDGSAANIAHNVVGAVDNQDGDSQPPHSCHAVAGGQDLDGMAHHAQSVTSRPFVRCCFNGVCGLGFPQPRFR